MQLTWVLSQDPIWYSEHTRSDPGAQCQELCLNTTKMLSKPNQLTKTKQQQQHHHQNNHKAKILWCQDSLSSPQSDSLSRMTMTTFLPPNHCFCRKQLRNRPLPQPYLPLDKLSHTTTLGSKKTRRKKAEGIESKGFRKSLVPVPEDVGRVQELEFSRQVMATLDCWLD